MHVDDALVDVDELLDEADDVSRSTTSQFGCSIATRDLGL
jgi:hypothetical protein